MLDFVQDLFFSQDLLLLAFCNYVFFVQDLQSVQFGVCFEAGKNDLGVSPSTNLGDQFELSD